MGHPDRPEPVAGNKGLDVLEHRGPSSGVADVADGRAPRELVQFRLIENIRYKADSSD